MQTKEELEEALALIRRPTLTTVTFPNTHGSPGSLAVQVGTDGWCHVYKETDDNGCVSLIIEVGKVDP